MGNTVGSRDKTFLTPAEAGFVAGFLEGDGCISAKVIPTSGSYRTYVAISFSQHPKNRIVLEHLQKLLGGIVSDYTHHMMSELVIRDRKEVKAILQNIYPFLVSKKEQARLALQTIEILDRSSRGRQRPSSEVLESVKLAEQIRLLNSNRKNKVVHTLEKVIGRLKEKNLVP